MTPRIFSFLFILSVFLSPLTLKSQIDVEIRNYMDSTEFMIENGRKLLIASLENKDYDKMSEILQYLLSLTEGEYYSAFNYLEVISTALISSDWKIIEEYAGNYHQYSRLKSNPSGFPIYPRIYNELDVNSSAIIYQVNQSELESEEKLLMILITSSIHSSVESKVYPQRLKEFRELYPDSKYSDFISNFLPNRTISEGSAGMAYVIGGGYLAPSGQLKDWISAGGNFNISMDFFINKIYSSLYLMIGTVELMQPLDAYVNETNVSLNPGEDFNYFSGGLKIGYHIIHNKKLWIAPFGNISGGSLESVIYKDPDKDEVKLFGSVILGTGISTIFKIKTFSYPKPYYNSGVQSTGFWGLKLEGGYDWIISTKKPEYGGGMGYLNLGLVLGFGN